MKAILFVFVLMLGQVLNAQDENINQLDNRGRKFGQWKGFHEDGSLRYEGQFRNDRPYGEFRHYFPSGVLRATNLYSMNGRVAHNWTFFENGTLMAGGKYVGQQKDSTWLYYSDTSGNLVLEENYKAGQLHGLTNSYFPDSGELHETLHYWEGERHGPWNKYFSDGSSMLKANYIHDILDGEITYYYPDGSVKVIGTYAAGIRVGVWKTYDENGQLIEEEKFE